MLIIVMIVGYALISIPTLLSAEEYGYDVRDNPFPNDDNYVGYNLYDFSNVQMYKVGDGTMSYRITDDGLHIWAESNSDNLYQSYLDLQKIEVKKNTKYVIAVRIDGYQNTGAIRVASNGDGANRNNLVTVKAKPYTYQYNEFTTLDDTEYIQLYYYPNYEQSGTGNSDFRNIMIYEVNDDNGYKPYEPYGGWYKFGVDNAASELGSYVLQNYYNSTTREYDIPLFPVSDYIYEFRLGNEDSSGLYRQVQFTLYYFENSVWRPLSFEYITDKSLSWKHVGAYAAITLGGRESYLKFKFESPSSSSIIRLNISYDLLVGDGTDDVVYGNKFKDSTFLLPSRFIDNEINNVFYNSGVAFGEHNSMTLLGLFGSSLNAIGDFFMKFLGYQILGISLLEVLSGIFIVVILLWVISFLR